MPRTVVARGGMRNRPPAMAAKMTPPVPPGSAMKVAPPAPGGQTAPMFKKGGKVKRKGKK